MDRWVAALPQAARWTIGALALLPGLAAAAPLPVPRPATGPAPSLVVPLPVPRPEEAGPVLPLPRIEPWPGPAAAGSGPPSRGEAFGPPRPPRPAAAEAPPEPDLFCAPLLAGGKVVAEPAPPVAEGEGCGIAAPVTLHAIVLRDGHRTALEPPALMRCDLAASLADWIRDDVAPATTAEGDLAGLVDAAAYVCRNRNWKAGERLSEHARGNAIDILAFRFARRRIGLKEATAGDVLTALRASACARFATVLGPGADAFHETDLHLDLQHRRSGFRLCQWNVR